MKTCNNPRKTLTGLRAKAQNIFGCEGCFLWFLEVTKTELSLFSSLFLCEKKTNQKKFFFVFFNSSVSDHFYLCHRVVEFSCFTYMFSSVAIFQILFLWKFCFCSLLFFPVTAFQLIQK